MLQQIYSNKLTKGNPDDEMENLKLDSQVGEIFYLA